MSEKPDGSTNLTDEQKAETADTAKSAPDTVSGGAPEEPDTTDDDGTPVENPSG